MAAIIAQAAALAMATPPGRLRESRLDHVNFLRNLHKGTL